jgi:dodecin
MTKRSGSTMIIAGPAEDPAPRSQVKPQAPAARAVALGDHLPASTTGPGGSVTSWRQQPGPGRTWSKESGMSVYRVTEIIGTSSTSWEDAAAEAIRTAAGTLRDLRVAEVVKQDIALDEGGAITYRTKLELSFKYEPGH